MPRRVVATFLFLVVHAPCGGSLVAQGVTTAAISGVVTDSRGQAVIGAEVDIVNRSTGFVTHSRSRDDGRYVASVLALGGPYTVGVRRIGLTHQSRDGLYLTLGQNLRVDFILTQQAVVLDGVVSEAASRAVSRTQFGAGTLISDSAIHRLPTADRDLYGFLRLVPQTSNVYGASSGGVSPRMNAIMIDGSSEQGLYGGNAAAAIWGGKAISLEAVKEYQVLLTPFDVRHGNFAGAMINAVTRSGTNDWGGSTFYYGRYGALSRNVPFIRDARFERAQAGLSLGGPLIRDRAHIFVASEFQRLLFPTVGPYVGQGASAISPLPVSPDTIARFESILSQYGLGGGSSGPVTAGNPLSNLFARIDVALPFLNSRLVLRENFSRTDSMAFSRPSPPPTANCPTIACFALSSAGRRQLVVKKGTVAQMFTTFPNGAYNELTAGQLGVVSTISSFVKQPLVIVRIPSPTASLQAGSYELAQGDNTDNQSFELTDNVTVPWRAHNLTFGITTQFFRIRRYDLRGAYGIWTFANLDALQQGVAQTYKVSRDFGGADVTMRGAQYALYAGDKWEVHPRLALNYGLRADVPMFRNRPAYSARVESSFARRTDAVPSGHVQWSPRFGFNLDATGDGRTTVHGGVGAFLGRPPLAWFVNSYANYGMPRTLTCGASPARGLPPAFTPGYANPPLACNNAVGFSTDSAGSVNLVNPNLSFPQSLRASLVIDRELPWRMRGTIEAIHTKALHELFFVNRNLAEPVGTDAHGRVLYGSIRTSGPLTGRSAPTPAVASFTADVIELTNQSKDYSYSVTGQLDKRFDSNLDATVSVTYGHAYDVQSLRLTRNPSFDNWRFARPVAGRQDALTLGVSDFDQPYRVIASGTYSVPWHGRTTDVSLYYLGNSGFPFTYLAGGDQNTGDLNADGTNINDAIYIPRDANDPAEILFDSTAALAPPAQRAAFERFIDGASCLRRQRGRIMERNSCRTQWVNTLNLSVRQSFPSVRAHRVAIEVQVFNLLNLLDGRWGRIAMPSSINTASSQVNLLTHTSQIAGSPQQSVFRFDPATRRFDSQNVDSYYQIQLGARYSF